MRPPWDTFRNLLFLGIFLSNTILFFIIYSVDTLPVRTLFIILGCYLLFFLLILDDYYDNKHDEDDDSKSIN